MNIRNKKWTTDSDKKNENIRDENDMMKNNIGLMQTEIVEKNSRIAQLETTNTKLYTQNNRLTDLCFGRKLVEKDIETGIKEEDVKKRGETEENREQKKRTNTQTKCYYNENTKCIKESCTFRHARKVCNNYNQNKV